MQRRERGRNQKQGHNMPFMKGKAPIRRTLNYLNNGKLILKNQIKVFAIHYNHRGEHHNGAREFAFWNLAQIRYKNPDTQVITMKDFTPSPFIRCFYGKTFLLMNYRRFDWRLKSGHSINLVVLFCIWPEDGKELIMDVDGKTKEEILQHCIKVIGKSA